MLLDFNDARPTSPAPLSVALVYAARGWPVFPCNPLNKRPMVERGFHAATTDAFTIRNWWLKWPQAMIGVPTGKAVGFWVLDIDTDTSKGKDGLGSLHRIGHDLSELTDTVVSRTASGGYHCLFRYDEAAPVTNARGTLPPHLDIRGDGGYIIAPGSRLSDGRAYEWLNPPGENEIDAAPDWLIEAIEARPSPTSFDFNTARIDGPNAAERALTIPPGQWHERTRDLVARMVREGATDETIAAIAPGFTEPGYTVAQTIREFAAHARTARERWGYAPKTPAIVIPETEDTPLTEDGRRRLPILSRAELRNREPPDYLIDEVITERSVVAVYGPSGSLKSFVAIDFSMCVAHGLPWHGRDVKQGAVVYVTGEGTDQIGQRFDAWDIANAKAGVDAPIHLIPLGVPVSDPTWAKALIEDIGALNITPVMVWFDTLARTFGQGDENSQKDMNAYISGIDTVRNALRCVAGIVHHTGKDGERGLRGSSALYAAMDTVIRTERKGMVVTLKNQQPHGKQKDGAEFEDIALSAKVFKVGADKKGRDLTSLALSKAEASEAEDGAEIARAERTNAPRGANQEAIMKALRQAKGEPMGLTRITAMVRKDSGTVANVLTALVEKGLVSQVGEEGAKRWVLQ